MDNHSSIATTSGESSAMISSMDFEDHRNAFAPRIVESEIFKILDVSENLWVKGSSPVKTKIVFGERGVIIPPREKENTYETTETINLGEELPAEVPPASYFDEADPDELEQDAARIKVETDRAFFNHMLLSRPAAPALAPAQPYVKDAVATPRGTFVNPLVKDRRELIFGDKLKKYLRSGGKKNICELMKEAVAESGTDGVLEGVWSDVTAVVYKKTVAQRDDVITTAQLLEDACDYLHRLFSDHMQTVVERNLERAERGGVPGVRGLVSAFLKVGADDPNAEDDNIDGLPIWEVTYHCVRAGDVSAAKDALTRLQSFPQSATLVAALNHLADNGKLDGDLKKKLKVEWRHNSSHIKDKHKRALYAALLGGLESALSDTLENWLWFKLFPLRVDPHITPLLYKEVQKSIAIDYGQQYFMANGRSEFQYFFTALWLSGQFERAIELLNECGQRVDCVHVAVLTHRLGYLRMTENSTDDMLVVDNSEATRCYLNLARLIVAYTKNFELLDVPRSLDYFFLLKGISTPTGSDVFEMAVSRSVYLTGNADVILGTLAKEGGRLPGLIDECVCFYS
ncbi:unnamed protein product [Caenorhabditis auriculariae]|uniref:Nuclear pore protein n=1 Tax=Caenorhabditis auriculariae TaxID=2777116 RepID=A0A8S1GMG0_9PELO|nr:unnamed protein product [Caenorhabditis auriculariae]